MVSPDVAEKPPWLRTRARVPQGANLRGELSSEHLRTVCDSSRCPNLAECWGKGHATFIVLGDRCTRSCRFCAVPSGIPSEPDLDEPERIAAAVKRLALGHVVVTSVTRDDLEDGGASIFAEIVRRIRWNSPGTTVELLIPDLKGERRSLEMVLEADPDVLGHNLEAVRSLQWVRDRRASYERSLRVLSMVKEISPWTITKSSLMLGLGEEDDEIREAMKDLRSAGVDALTLGQYLPPRGSRLPLKRYVTPEEFARWDEMARKMGFKGVRSGPLVRSSYDARALFKEVMEDADRRF